MYNYVFFGWISGIRNCLYELPPGVVIWSVLIFTIAVLLCIHLSLSMDLADKYDILADKYNNPCSFYDGTYELPRSNIRKAMIYANLSYHTFWNIVVMCRFRVCLHKCPQVYFRVNRFSELGLPFFVLVRALMFLSLAFVWGYPLFLLIVLCRMMFYKSDLC